jgi:hypothetical protein
MNTLTMLLTLALLSVLSSTVALKLLAKPLVALLQTLCPNETSTAFWWVYTKVMIIIAPLLLVVMVDSLWHTDDYTRALRQASIAVLLGLLVAFYVMGKRISQFANPTAITKAKS